jgi:hypothetical protein
MPQIAADFLLGPDWESRLISWFGQGANGWSHVAPVLADGRYLDARSDVCVRVNERCNVPYRVPAGVHIRDPQSEKWVKKCRVSLEVDQPTYDAWEENLRTRIGDGYGVSDIWAFITGRDRHKAAHWVCSAHWIDSLQHIKKVRYPLQIQAHQITPDAAYLISDVVGFTIGPIQTVPKESL